MDKIGGNETAVAERYPVQAVDYLEANGLADAPGYNSYNWGGYPHLARAARFCGWSGRRVRRSLLVLLLKKL
ncbi:MAG: hypothetical protein M5U34_22145 [Chloroflexi bacterium]|nr:hypothetical protein [Chloroflexota bacterium]